jgi:hypothetical protein
MRTLLSHDAAARWSATGDQERDVTVSSPSLGVATSYSREPWEVEEYAISLMGH